MTPESERTEDRGPHSSGGTVASPAVIDPISRPGELLAGRYRLEDHVGDDSRGRQVWRGIDVILRRPIAVVLKHPGGLAAADMLSAGVTASRLSHPHLLGVYDAIDEEARAYIVREWVDGTSLRDLVADGPLEPELATSISHAVASAIAAAHATGMIHGNVQPGSVIVADDGRVVLADPHADESATQESDVRAIGGVLYCALTGRWPYAELGVDRSVPDAVRDTAGVLQSPRQVRGGVPTFLSDLTVGLLDPARRPPTADSIRVDLARVDSAAADEFYGDGPLGFAAASAVPEASARRRGLRRLLVGAAVLVVIAVGGLMLAKTIGGSPDAIPQGPSASSGAGSAPSAGASAAAVHPVPVKLGPDSVRIIETGGDGSELANAAATVDGSEATKWQSSRYTLPRFGNLDKEMGLLINLGSVRNVTQVKVDFYTPGETVQAYVGNSDPGLGNANSKKIVSTYKPLGEPQVAAASEVFPIGVETRYVLILVTSLPPAWNDQPGFQFGIDEVAVSAHP